MEEEKKGSSHGPWRSQDEKPIKKTRGRMQHGQFGKTLAYLRNGKVSIAGTLEKTPEK